MGKVKKANRGTKEDRILKKKEILGKKARYVGLGDKHFQCNCGKSFKKGMVSEYQAKMYCSERCIEASLK